MNENAASTRRDVLSSERNSKGKTYDQMAEELCVSKGVLWKFLNTNYVPTNPTIRHRLGIPQPIISYRTRNPKGQFD